MRYAIGLASGAMTLAMTLILAGCGGGEKSVTAQNASTAEVAQKVKEAGIVDDKFISPGRWQMQMTVTDMQIPGMPPAMAQKMKAQMGPGRSFQHCVTPEEAKKPQEDFFAGEQAKSCRYEKFAMGDGKINMIMHCAQGGSRQTVKMDGTYAPDSYHMTMASTMEGQPGSPTAGMHFNATVDAKRLGVCTGKEPG
ncbi:MAG: DUF3617 domain-containing protein [Sphingobium sp.]